MATFDDVAPDGVRIRLPDFCAFSENTLPEKGIVLFVMGHELGHNLIDVDPRADGLRPGSSLEFTEATRMVKDVYEKFELNNEIIRKIFGEISHLNTDLMALLTVQALGIQLDEVISNSLAYYQRRPYSGKDSYLNDVFLFRFMHLRDSILANALSFEPSSRVCRFKHTSEFLISTKNMKYFNAVLTNYFSSYLPLVDIETEKLSGHVSPDCFTSAPKDLTEAFTRYIEKNRAYGMDKLGTYKKLSVEE